MRRMKAMTPEGRKVLMNILVNAAVPGEDFGPKARVAAAMKALWECGVIDIAQDPETDEMYVTNVITQETFGPGYHVPS